MRWSRVCIESLAYVLPEERVSSLEIERRLAALYQQLRLSPGQLEVLTGIRERRVWPRGTAMADAAARAGRRALELAGLSAAELGAVVYGGVCKDELEPAAACRVAHSLGAPPEAMVFDVSNACLGMLNGVVEIANRIELGQIRAGLVVAAESSREIVDQTIDRMLADPSLEELRMCLATLTGGSAAAAIVLTDASISDATHLLLGGSSLSAPEHHGLCRWGPKEGLLGTSPQVTDTDASALLIHGVDLGKRTFGRFIENMRWRLDDIDRVVCHQVGAGNRRTILGTLGLSEERDFSTFETLGNTGSVALPMSAAMAVEQGFIAPGDRVALLGIGSGLGSIMLGVQW
jgi:3-oxoacyl-[acyl-carrier-protein] synthase-3